MIIRIIPPQSSARNFRAMPQPKRMPNSNPMSDITKDTKPIIEIGTSISEKSRIPRNANETPMASASMLVAMANASTTFRLFGSYSFLQSSSLKDECNPMVQTFYQVAERAGTYPPEEWHDSLE